MRFWKKKDKKPYPRSFAKRLTWRIMLPTFIVMAIITSIVVFIAWMIALTSASLLCDRQLDYKAKSVEQTLTEVYTATVNTVPDIEGNLHRPDRIQGIMKRIVDLNPHIRSCGISFRENYYPQKGRWFCPYACRQDSDSIITMKIIGSRQHDYLQKEWFQEAMKAKGGYWSKPFFEGTDHKTALVAYLQPIRDELDSTVAVLGVDISLEKLSRDASRQFYGINDSTKTWSASNEVYYFIVDSTGTFLMHPDQKRIINDNYFEMAKKTSDPSDDYAGQVMIKNDESGHLMGDDNSNDIVIDGETVTVNYATLEHTPWTMVMVFPTFYIELAGYIIGGILTFFIVIGLLVVFIAGRRTIKKATKPLNQLAVSANEVAKGHFGTVLPEIKSHDEIHQLRDSFDNMQQSLTQYIEELKTTTAQKSAIESELKIAHDIQMAMLPKTFPPFPERNDVDVYGTLTPAKGVGGDLFDFYIRDERLFFCIGDVSGKGIPAALVMAMTRSLFRNISSYASQPASIVYALNNALSDNNDTNMFVTAFVGVLNLADGQLQYCNAGHNVPLLVGRGVGTLPCESNVPVGVIPDFKFSQQEVYVDPQMTIFLFTDGLNEAENAMHNQFGDERIHDVAQRVLAEIQYQPLNFIYEMNEAVHEFVAGAEQSDDLTMLAIQYKGSELKIKN